MSTILIKEHDENVTELIPKIVEECVASPRYNSKYQKKLIKESAKCKNAHRTFGVAHIPLSSPSQYLKKKSRIEPRKPVTKHVHPKRSEYQRELQTWLPVKKVIKDKLAEFPQDSVTLGRINFSKQNIINVKNSKPQQPKKRYVDTRYGTVHDLEPSGLLPIYIFRKEYGKPPNFVLQRHKLKHKKTETKIERDAQLRPLCRYVTEDEHASLLYGMKKRWDEMTNQFQCLPFLTDTPPKAKRKSRMEDDLRQLEKDIEIIERHPYIYVYSDAEDEC